MRRATVGTKKRKALESEKKKNRMNSDVPLAMSALLVTIALQVGNMRGALARGVTWCISRVVTFWRRRGRL